MKYLTLLFIFFVSCTSSDENAEKEIKVKNTETIANDAPLVWLVTGLPNLLDASNVVAKEYGFQLFQIAGCIVDSALSDSIDTVNNRLDKKLKSKFGDSWQAGFQTKVAAMEEKYKKMNDLMRKYPPFTNREHKLDKEGYDLVYEITPLDTTYVLFEVNTRYYLRNEGQPAFIKDSSYLIDLNTKKISLKSL